MALNHVVEIKCPNCSHLHRRCIKDGQIYEFGRHGTDIKEEILVTMASYSKEPLTQKMKLAHEQNSYANRRDGAIIPDREPMYDRWLEIAARERGEV
jgi:ribosomal protein L32